MATDSSASSGHSENQSMVQQVMRLGNCLRRALNTSPMGLRACSSVCSVSVSVVCSVRLSVSMSGLVCVCV